jgi:hypothetical protein
MDVMLVDGAQDMAAEWFDKALVPMMQVHKFELLVAGTPDPTGASMLTAMCLLAAAGFAHKLDLTQASSQQHWAHWLSKAKAARLKRK